MSSSFENCFVSDANVVRLGPTHGIVAVCGSTVMSGGWHVSAAGREVSLCSTD